MESLDEGTKSKNSFFKHVFNFDEDSKGEMLNIIQYALLAIIPVVILNKGMQKFVPEADEEKGSFEVLAEVVAQIVVMFIGLLFINRIITYVPTYSGIKYPDFSVVCIILIGLMITMSLHTKLGEKVGILVDRVVALWEGDSASTPDAKKKSKKGAATIKVSQPISQSTSQMAINQAMYTDGTSISQLPTTQNTQQMPDYNNMVRNDSNPLVNAATPSASQGFQNGGFNEPMAANETFGGAFGGSAW